MPRCDSDTNATLENPSPARTSVFASALTLLAASCTMNWVRALSSAVRAFGLHLKGRPFKSDSAHHCDASPFSGDVVQLLRTLPRRCALSRASGFFPRQRKRKIPFSAPDWFSESEFLHANQLCRSAASVSNRTQSEHCQT